MPAVIAGLLTTLALLLTAPAMAYTVDKSLVNGPLTGLWNNAAEPGWGATVTHQYDKMFVTMFAYDNSGKPTWYVASSCNVSASGCSGSLYSVSGGTNPISAWGSPNTITTQVGTLTLAFADATSGTMSYSINGSNGSKSVSKALFASLPGQVAVPLQTAFANIAHKGLGGNFTVSGWVADCVCGKPLTFTSVTGSGKFTLEAATGKAIMNNTNLTYANQTITGTAIAGAESIPLASTSTIFYDAATFATVYLVNDGVSTPVTPAAIPASITAGSTGSLGNANGGFNETYSVATDSSSSLLVSILTQSSTQYGGTSTKTQFVYRMDTLGNVSPVSITTTKLYLGAAYQALTYTFQ